MILATLNVASYKSDFNNLYSKANLKEKIFILTNNL